MTAKQRQTLQQALLHVEPERSGGGQAANTVYALARLGFGAAMVGRVGRRRRRRSSCSPSSRRPTRATWRAAARPGACYVLLDETGERRNLVWPAANDEFSPPGPAAPPAAQRASPTSARFVGDGPLEAQLALLQRLPATSRSPSTPARSTPARASSASSPSCSAAPICSPRETELEMLCGLAADESLDFLLNVGVGLVVCKMGGRGARLIGRRVDLYVPPLPAEVVDVTGAGDLFAAGFLAGMIEQVGLEIAGRLGAWAAAAASPAWAAAPTPTRPPGASASPRSAPCNERHSTEPAVIGRQQATVGHEDRLALHRPRPGSLQPARRHRRPRPAGRSAARDRRRLLRPRARREPRERPLPRPRPAPRLPDGHALERRELARRPGAGVARRSGATSTTAGHGAAAAATASACSCWPATCSSPARPCAAATRSSTCTRRCPAAPPAPGRTSSGSCSSAGADADRRHDPPGHAAARPRPGGQLLRVPHHRRRLRPALGAVPRQAQDRRAWREIAAAEGEAEPLFAAIRAQRRAARDPAALPDDEAVRAGHLHTAGGGRVRARPSACRSTSPPRSSAELQGRG